MMNVFAALVYLSILLAPAPPSLALNPQTNECGAYWGGDEWTYYKLPDGWKIYYPQDDLITTDAGSCPRQGNWDAAVESCCRKLGYTYVPGNLGVERGRIGRTPYAYMLMGWLAAPCVLVALIIIVILLFVRRRKRPVTP